MATSHRHATANGANSDHPPNDDIIQTNSAGVHMDTGVDSTSVRDDQRWWQSDQEGISLLATAAGAAGELPYPCCLSLVCAIRHEQWVLMT
eukprot:scaffold14941_cov53-Attheya_sp.AAC.1